MALDPIARNEAEVAVVRRMVGVLEQTGNLWLALLQGTSRVGEVSWWSDLGLRLRLWSNQLLLGRMGVTRVPVALSTSLDVGGSGCGVNDDKDCL